MNEMGSTLMSVTTANYSDPKQGIKNYMEKIDSIVEVDYGDFKRKLSQYLQRIEELLGPKMRGMQSEIIQEIRLKAVYYPEMDIEDAREFSLEKLNSLIESL